MLLKGDDTVCTRQSCDILTGINGTGVLIPLRNATWSLFLLTGYFPNCIRHLNCRFSPRVKDMA